MDDRALLLENQLCFPLYAASKAVLGRYKPLLDDIGLTYTQYIVMMVLWADKSLSVSGLGKRLYLDSGTLTPLLKRLEEKGLIRRTRFAQDERKVIVTLTKEGEALKVRAMEIPPQIGRCLNLNIEEAATLYRLLYKVLAPSACSAGVQSGNYEGGMIKSN
jgi:DNA-binding MarR family transcriptional regulator